MNISKYIKTNRKNLNMTQKELAKTLNVSHITVCRWESNVIVPNEQNWVILQNLFGTRNDNLTIPAIQGNKIIIKNVTKLNKLEKYPKTQIRDNQIVENYKKGISLDNLAKFYNLSETTIRSIIIKKIKIKRKFTKKPRICTICNKTFYGTNKKTCSKKCKKILQINNIKNKYRINKNQICPVCNKNFTSNRIQKYCSVKCYDKFRINGFGLK